MSVAVARNFGPLNEIDLVTIDDWAAIGRLTRERIIRRTQQGIDEDDTPFAPYSPAYEAAKVKAGGTPRVDLQLSGEMLRSIVIAPDRDGVTLSFSS